MRKRMEAFILESFLSKELQMETNHFEYTLQTLRFGNFPLICFWHLISPWPLIGNSPLIHPCSRPPSPPTSPTPSSKENSANPPGDRTDPFPRLLDAPHVSNGRGKILQPPPPMPCPLPPYLLPSSSSQTPSSRASFLRSPPIGIPPCGSPRHRWNSLIC
jgi:hypothetical protein